jgi:hypothetical protein
MVAKPCISLSSAVISLMYEPTCELYEPSVVRSEFSASTAFRAIQSYTGCARGGDAAALAASTIASTSVAATCTPSLRSNMAVIPMLPPACASNAPRSSAAAAVSVL